MKGQDLPDVQATKPEIEVGLSRVGVKGVKKLIEIERGGEAICIDGHIRGFGRLTRI